MPAPNVAHATTSTSGGEPLVTIVIPAFDAADSIAAAVLSIVGQAGAEHLRVVVVDDGSTDGTAAALADVVRDHPSVSVVTQPNAGVAAARNRALAEVATPFVGFLDADDELAPTYAQRIASVLTASPDVDIVEFNARLEDDTGRELGVVTCVADDDPPHAELDDTVRQAVVDRFNNYLWCRVVRTALMRQVPFPVGRTFEDVAVVPTLYVLAHHVARIPASLVVRRLRAGSIMHTPDAAKARDWLRCSQEAFARPADGVPAQFWPTVGARTFEGFVRTSADVRLTAWPAARRVVRRERHWFAAQAADAPPPAAELCARVLTLTDRVEVEHLRRAGTRAARQCLGRRGWRRRARAVTALGRRVARRPT